MLGNRTRSPVALARHNNLALAQNGAANIVRAASDSAVVVEAITSVNEAVEAQQDQLAALDSRVGNLEDIP